MGPFERQLKDVLTYWGPAGRDDFAGQSFDAPILIYGRWVEDSKLVLNSLGQEVNSQAQVMVNQEVAESGYLAQGDQRTSANPSSVTGAWKIQAFTSAPDVRHIEQARIAFL